VRQLFPSPAADVDPLDAYDEWREPPAGRPWVVADMIASVDGATAVAGRSGGLGGAADKAVFRALRTVPDVVLVGAATARIERYGPVQLPEASVRRRLARGQAALPRLALVSGQLDLDPGDDLFRADGARPLVFTTETAPAGPRADLEAVAEVVTSGQDRVDLGEVLRRLRVEGARVVLAEGGPSLNGQLVAGGWVDEWCQSVAPLLAGGGSARVAHGPEPTAPTELALHRVLEADGYLFTTHRRR
jgi:riboflavin biosynthesis pyrimidine reductase